MSLIKLFLLFAKIGAILLGGGYVIFPIMTNEFCEKRSIVSREDLLDYFALSQSLPGIIAANMSMFVGYKLRGKIGALVAIIGITFVPFWIIVLLASVISFFVNNHYVKNALFGIDIAVIALIILTIRETWQNTNKNSFYYIIFVLSLISLILLKLSPIQTILIFSICGVLVKKIAGGRI